MSGARVSVMVLALMAVFIRVPGVASAQVGAALGGFVSDDTGASLPGVTVTITNTANGTTQVLVTGADGNYRAIGLSPAPYQVNVQLSGFAPETRTLTLTVGADAKVDFKLKVAGLQETVTVSGKVHWSRPRGPSRHRSCSPIRSARCRCWIAASWCWRRRCRGRRR